MDSTFFDKLNDSVIERIKELSTNEDATPNENLVNLVQNQLYENYNQLNLIYENCLHELDNLIGLNEVKEEIKKLVNYLIYYKKVSNSITLDKINLNMIFRGNPGTGKTTVAKIISNLLFELGFTTSDNVVEATPRDFIAGYVGQTAIKAKDLIDRAKGGVIFIDEAYTFVTKGDEKGGSYALEAITEIIKEMEKNETVFIFAGYQNEMNEFINLNPGIKSRIGYDIYFEDYSPEDLLKMFLNKLNRTGLKIEKNAISKVMEIIKERSKVKNFGNGRMIDNLYNEIIREHAFMSSKEFDEERLLTISLQAVENVKI